MGLTREELAGMLAIVGVPEKQRRMRMRQIWHWIYHRGALKFAEMTDISQDLRAKLDDAFAIGADGFGTNEAALGFDQTLADSQAKPCACALFVTTFGAVEHIKHPVRRAAGNTRAIIGNGYHRESAVKQGYTMDRAVGDGIFGRVVLDVDDRPFGQDRISQQCGQISWQLNLHRMVAQLSAQPVSGRSYQGRQIAGNNRGFHCTMAKTGHIKQVLDIAIQTFAFFANGFGQFGAPGFRQPQPPVLQGCPTPR